MAEPGRRTHTVLVVEDDDLFRRSLMTYISSLGYESASAATGEEALDRCRGSDISLCLADVQLPGMDGVDLAMRLRRESPDVRVVLMTGVVSDEVRLGAEEAGVRTILRKPTDLALLARTLNDLISETYPT